MNCVCFFKKGKLASQTAHAAVSCFVKSLESKSKQSIASKWLKCGQPKIVLKVDTLEELEDLRNKANESDITTSLIQDAGRTQISAGTATCLGIGPDYDEKIDEIVKHLKLL